MGAKIVGARKREEVAALISSLATVREKNVPGPGSHGPSGRRGSKKQPTTINHSHINEKQQDRQDSQHGGQGRRRRRNTFTASHSERQVSKPRRKENKENTSTAAHRSRSSLHLRYLRAQRAHLRQVAGDRAFDHELTAWYSMSLFRDRDRSQIALSA